ncbi:MAG: hypothetical protein AB1726_01315 [Planctomycetota bacterium]
MSGALRRPLFAAKTAVVGAALAAVALWRAGLAAVEGVRELCTRAPLVREAVVLPADARIDRTLADMETRLGFGRGELRELHRVLAAQVDYSDTIFVVSDLKHPRRSAITSLSCLLFPLRLVPLGALPADGPSADTVIDEHTWILELEPVPPAEIAAWFDPVARGSAFALSRGKKMGR